MSIWTFFVSSSVISLSVIPANFSTAAANGWVASSSADFPAMVFTVPAMAPFSAMSAADSTIFPAPGTGMTHVNGSVMTSPRSPAVARANPVKPFPSQPASWKTAFQLWFTSPVSAPPTSFSGSNPPPSARSNARFGTMWEVRARTSKTAPPTAMNGPRRWLPTLFRSSQNPCPSGGCPVRFAASSLARSGFTVESLARARSVCCAASCGVHCRGSLVSSAPVVALTVATWAAAINCCC